MAENASIYRPGGASETGSDHVIIVSEWTEIEETRPLAFVYVAVASLFGVIAAVWVAIYLLG